MIACPFDLQPECPFGFDTDVSCEECLKHFMEGV